MPVCSFDFFSRFDKNTRDTTFSVGLEGVAADDVDKVLGIVDDTFKQVAQ